MRTARTVGIAVDEPLRRGLDEVVEHFANGNRSEFVRLAVRDYQARMRRDALEAIRREARTNMGGRTMTPDEIMALVKAETSADPA